MIRPDVLDSERPYGPWSCRGCDIWDAMRAAASGDTDALRRLLERDPNLTRAEYWYTQPIHFAVREGHLEAVRILLEAGADPGTVALSGDDLTTIARDRGHEAVVRLLEETRARRGPDRPDAPAERAAGPEPATSLGTALHAAARAGDLPLVERLLEQGADPSFTIDSSGSATYAAATPELRALLVARGGTLDAFDLVWLGEDDELIRRVTANPAAANSGCGGVFTAACKLGKRDLVLRLLEAGARVPPVVTGCRSYLLTDPDLLRLLLASGMSPDLPSWQLATPLHDLCNRDGRGRPLPRRTECATVLLDAGATLDARDEDYRSTPLGWAARNDLLDLVELLLDRGAATNLPDDEPWATPLAWATRRGHREVAERLRVAGATA